MYQSAATDTCSWCKLETVVYDQQYCTIMIPTSEQRISPIFPPLARSTTFDAKSEKRVYEGRILLSTVT